jgi:hypothetical protein
VSISSIGRLGLDLEFDLENDLEVDDNGDFHIITLVFADTGNEAVFEGRTSFEDVISNLLDFYRDDSTTLSGSGAGQLHAIASRMSRHVEDLRSLATHLEGELGPEDYDDLTFGNTL